MGAVSVALVALHAAKAELLSAGTACGPATPRADGNQKCCWVICCAFPETQKMYGARMHMLLSPKAKLE